MKDAILVLLLVAMFVALIAAVIHAVDREAVVHCNELRGQARIFPHFTVSQEEADVCANHGVQIAAKTDASTY